MSDLISRQAAIDAVKEFQHGAKEWRDEQEADSNIWHRADSAIASAIEIGLRIKKIPYELQEFEIARSTEEYERKQAEAASVLAAKARRWDETLSGPSCYNCRHNADCDFLPLPGENVRFNCPHWGDEKGIDLEIYKKATRKMQDPKPNETEEGEK